MWGFIFTYLAQDSLGLLNLKVYYLLCNLENFLSHYFFIHFHSPNALLFKILNEKFLDFLILNFYFIFSTSIFVLYSIISLDFLSVQILFFTMTNRLFNLTTWYLMSKILHFMSCTLLFLRIYLFFFIVPCSYIFTPPFMHLIIFNTHFINYYLY